MLKLTLSPSEGKATLELTSGHTLEIPLDHRAGPMLERILIAQQASGQARIGTEAAPLQSMIKEWMSYGGKTYRVEPPKARGSIEISLEELGLV